MLKAKFWAVAAAAAVIVAGVAADAEAFCHKYRSIPVWFGVYYPNCGSCGGCIMPYVASGCYSGYGYCGIGCGGCASGCGYGCAASSHRCAAHKTWKRYFRGWGGCFGCGDTCDGCGGDGCGSDGCGAGCSSCNAGDAASSEVISNGPAPAEDGASIAPDDQSAAVRRPLILLAGLRNNQADGSAAFEKGLTAYRQGSMNDAAREFEAASSSEPDNALYHYYRALAQHDLYGAEAADEALEQAIAAELRAPVKGWGQRMERVQGRARLWVEKARREAGLVR